MFFSVFQLLKCRLRFLKDKCCTTGRKTKCPTIFLNRRVTLCFYLSWFFITDPRQANFLWKRVSEMTETLFTKWNSESQIWSVINFLPTLNAIGFMFYTKMLQVLFILESSTFVRKVSHTILNSLRYLAFVWLENDKKKKWGGGEYQVLKINWWS